MCSRILKRSFARLKGYVTSLTGSLVEDVNNPTNDYGNATRCPVEWRCSRLFEILE